MGAGLQRDVNGCAFSASTGLTQGHGLRVRTTAGLGPAPAKNAIVLHDDTADGWIGLGLAKATISQSQRRAHPPKILVHRAHPLDN